MPVHAQIQPLLDAINAGAAALTEPQTVAERREGYMGLSTIVGPGPEVDTVTTTEIAGVPVRIYAPADAVGIFVFYHGGGYTIGDLDSHDQPCRQLAVEAGATIISVDYRLAPEHPFPAGVEDSWAVLSAVAANRSEYGAADARIVVGGDSAGGNLSAVMALMARDADLDLAAQLLIYPAVNAADDSPSMTENSTGYILTAETMAWFQEQYAADPTDWRASPLLAGSHADLAPALVITAEFDPLRDQGAAYAATLEENGVSVTHTNYESMVHAFFQLGPICDAGAAAVTQVAAMAREALRG